MANEKEKMEYRSGIYGKAEVRFGGRIAIEPVRFVSPDGRERHGLTLAEFYNGGEVGETPQDQRTHDDFLTAHGLGWGMNV